MSKQTMVLLYVLVAVAVLTGGFFGYRYLYLSNDIAEELSTPKLVSKNKIVVGLDATYISGAYPAKMSPSSQELAYNNNIYQPLASFDRNRRLLPGSGIASSWTNPTPTTWRFVINPNAKFSDNTPVSANDVKFSYDTVMKNSYPIGAFLPTVKEVKVIDNNTVDFITTTPNPTLVNKLSYLLIISKQDISKNGLDNPVGSGPYKPTTIDESKGEIRHLVVNPNYWKETPKIREVVFKGITANENETQSQAHARTILAGEVDMTLINDKVSLDSIQKDSTLTSKSWQDAAVSFLAINSLANTPFKKAAVRKAVNLVVDPVAIAETSTIPTQVVDELVPSMVFGYNPEIRRPALNTVKAKADLTAAGYPNGFSFKFMSYEGQSESQLNAIKAQFAKIGITMLKDEAKGADYMTRLMTGDYVMTYSSYSADSGDASEVIEQLYHTRDNVFGSSNLGYSNKEVDDLIEQAATILDMKQRQSYLKQALKLLTDDVAYIPLFTAITTYAVKKDIFWQPRLDGYIKYDEMAGLE